MKGAEKDIEESLVGHEMKLRTGLREEQFKEEVIVDQRTRLVSFSESGS